jgi:hypothetical protein
MALEDGDEEEDGAVAIADGLLLSSRAMRSLACAIDSVNAAFASFSS